MSKFWSEISWSTDTIAQAFAHVAQASHLPNAGRAPTQGGRPPGVSVGQWVKRSAEWAGLALDDQVALLRDVGALLRGGHPVIVRDQEADPAQFWIVLRTEGETGIFLCPDLSQKRLPLRDFEAHFAAPFQAQYDAEAEQCLSSTTLKGAARERAAKALSETRRGARRVSGLWLLKLPPSLSLAERLARVGLSRRLTKQLLFHGLAYALFLGAVAAFGSAALSGRMEAGWLGLSALLVLSSLAVRAKATWMEGTLAVDAGHELKRRLLQGALDTDDATLRRKGAGELLATVVEAGAVESLVLGGGGLAGEGLLELLLAPWVLTRGAGGALPALALGLWCAAYAALFVLYARRRRAWTETRLEATKGQVERMVGHRTVLTQQKPEREPHASDVALARYVERSEAMDRVAVLLTSAPRAWLVLGLLAWIPGVLAGADSLAMAIGLAGLLLVFRAANKLSIGSLQLVEAWITWKHVEPLLSTEPRPHEVGRPELSSHGAGESNDLPMLEARDVSYKHQGRSEAVLQGIQLQVQRGDRLLLEGPSGGGKSTLASILCALREPDQGTVLLSGLDVRTLGSKLWRRRVAAVPQFHDNHVFSESLAFNLLMGRSWPPSPKDLADAEETCEALGLGPLLERMPSGIMQQVGESGWQLSHGEKSRVFLARALLQAPDLMVLDESFAALDPENLAKVMETVNRRADALLVIAHP